MHLKVERDDGSNGTDMRDRATDGALFCPGSKHFDGQRRDTDFQVRQLETMTPQPTNKPSIDQLIETRLSDDDRTVFRDQLESLAELTAASERVCDIARGFLKMGAQRARRALMVVTTERLFFAVQHSQFRNVWVELRHRDLASVEMKTKLVSRGRVIVLLTVTGMISKFFPAASADAALIIEQIRTLGQTRQSE